MSKHLFQGKWISIGRYCGPKRTKMVVVANSADSSTGVPMPQSEAVNGALAILRDFLGDVAVVDDVDEAVEGNGLTLTYKDTHKRNER
jgi:hypothetical protein